MDDDNILNIDRRNFRRYFLNSVCDHTILSREEEQELLEAAQAGDAESFHTLILHNVRLVVSIANEYMGRGVDRQDLESEGLIGLMHALERFDLDRPNRFSTYAESWIRQHIVRAIARDSRAIRLPCWAHDYVRRLSNEAKRLTLETRREVSPYEAMEVVGEECNDRTLKCALAADQKTVSLDLSFNPTDETEDTLGERLPADTLDLGEQCDRSLLAIRVREVLQRLPYREYRVLRWRFGFDGPVLTFAECGDKLGVTRERARQIEARALGRLRHPANARDLRVHQ